ncbi:MAG: hypothetical protein JWM87_4320 [Candidatus Eremiobacteraeota bacterium]|nr:hypothetical protein [Candidatus Eremiobacteraeota bacterium]
MNRKDSTHGAKDTAREPIRPGEIRLSPNAIAAAETMVGRKLRSDVPVLPPEQQRQIG